MTYFSTCLGGFRIEGEGAELDFYNVVNYLYVYADIDLECWWYSNLWSLGNIFVTLIYGIECIYLILRHVYSLYQANDCIMYFDTTCSWMEIVKIDRLIFRLILIFNSFRFQILTFWVQSLTKIQCICMHANLNTFRFILCLNVLNIFKRIIGILRN